MKDISSVLLIIFAILSVSIRLFKKAMSQLESEQPAAPMKKYWEPVSIVQEEESDLPTPKIYDAPAMTEEPKTEPTAKSAEIPENPSISDDFDLTKAVIYSEILKPRTFDEY